jgi:hypothetical protein
MSVIMIFSLLFSLGAVATSEPSAAASLTGPYIVKVGTYNASGSTQVTAISTGVTFRLILALKDAAGYQKVALDDGYLDTFSPVNGLAGFTEITTLSDPLLVNFVPDANERDDYQYYYKTIRYNGNGAQTLPIVIQTPTDTTQETIVVPGVIKLSETTPLPPVTPDYQPVIRIQDGATAPLMLSGTSATLDIPLENVSADFAKDIIVTLSEPGSTPFKLDQSSTYAAIDNLSKGSPKVARFNVYVSPTAQSKIYALKLNLQYKDADNQSHTDTSLVYYVRVKAANIEPTIGITNYRFIGEKVIAGKKDQIALVLENAGTIDANDVRVKLTGFDAGNLRLSGDVDTKYVGTVAGKQTSVATFNIIAPSGAKSGTHELTAEITYIDLNGKEYAVTSKIYVQIDGNELSTLDMKILGMSRPRYVSPGATFSVSFVLKNEGRSEASMIEVSMEYPSDAIVPKTSPKQTLRTLKPGEARNMTFTFQARKTAAANFYDLYANVKYNSVGIPEPLQVREYAGISVTELSGGDSGATGRPKIIIRDYGFGGDAVLAGTEFDLQLDLYNTSSSEGIKNIKVTLKPEEGVFAPIGMASSFFIENMGRQQMLTKVIRMRVKNDAAVKTYGLTITFEYEDSKGNAYDEQKNPYKEEETVSIPVIQPVRLETSEIGMPPEAYLNNPIPLSFEFYNLGKSILYNMMVKVEGNFQIQGSNYFVGNFEAGRSDYFDTTLIPMAEGETTGMVVFEYEDANGVTGRVEKPFTVRVMPDPMNTPGEGFPGEGEVPPEGMPQGPASKLLILAILAALAGLVGGVLIWKHRLEKKRKLMAEAVEEDE